MKNALTSIQIITAALATEFDDTGWPLIGLFDSAKPQPDALFEAQQLFINMLFRELQNTDNPRTSGAQTSAQRILLAGESLGSLARLLTRQNHDVVWLAGTTPELDIDVPAEYGDIKFESLLTTASTGPFDCILFAATFHYLDQLAVLSKARKLLGSGGHLFLCGEFLRDDSKILNSSLANLSSHTQLAERLGYQKIDTADYSASAQVSARIVNDLLCKHAGFLQEKFALPLCDWQVWQKIFADMEQELASGCRCYQLHHWMLPDHSSRQSGEYAQAEYGDIQSFAAAEIGKLFEQSFNKPFDPALWHWKYQLGNGKCVVARVDAASEIVAHYGGAPRQIRYFGEPGMAIQVCDVMVLPEKRREYGRSSLFFKVAATFLEREIGNTVRHLLGFGFPNQSAMNIAIRLGLYEKTDDFVEVVYPDPPAAMADIEVVKFDIDNASHRKEVLRLWELMAVDFADGIIGVRDAQYIKYRYFDHPGATQFTCRLLRDINTREILAIVVLKAHGDAQLLVDMVCPAGQIADVIAAVNQWVRLNSLGEDLRLWLTRGWLQAIPLAGAIVNELNIEIPCNSWNPGPKAATLYGKWWLTAGDMDFM